MGVSVKFLALISVTFIADSSTFCRNFIIMVIIMVYFILFSWIGFNYQSEYK